MDNLLNIEEELIERYNIYRKTIIQLGAVEEFYSAQITEDDKIKLQTARTSKEDVTQALQTLDEKPSTKKRVACLIAQTNRIINALVDNNYGWKISKNQGLIFETAIYFFIATDIEGILDSVIYACHIPVYKYSPDSNFDYTPLKQVLIDFRDSLISQVPKDYIELENKVEKLLNKIKELAESDYKANVFNC